MVGFVYFEYVGNENREGKDKDDDCYDEDNSDILLVVWQFSIIEWKDLFRFVLRPISQHEQSICENVINILQRGVHVPISVEVQGEVIQVFWWVSEW